MEEIVMGLLKDRVIEILREEGPKEQYELTAIITHSRPKSQGNPFLLGVCLASLIKSGVIEKRKLKYILMPMYM